MQVNKGFLTIAQNTATTDYLRLAYLQAMSIKLVMPKSQYAVLVDKETMEQVTDNHRTIFDHIILIENDYAVNEEWKLSNEWQLFALSPFKETIKVESDLIFTRSIDHWWDAFRLRDIVLSTGCKNYKQETSNVREYRKLFDDNQLPDTYSGLMYFRYTKTASEFFKTAKEVCRQWDYVSKNLLKNCRDPNPTTDVVFALTAKIIGVEQCTLPTVDFINFVHMKPAINNWANKPLHDVALTELNLPMVRIANVNQYHPLHYHDKTWATDDIIKEYENEFL